MDGKLVQTSLPPQALFHYCASHEVLVCTVCQYAVQPGGIVRHLKDIHHIYRENRRPYVTYASKLNLRKPEDIRHPSPDEFPVPYLPLEKGWHCKAPGCEYLCVSIKRMETHWSAKHGRKGNPSHDWNETPLQTFFRGNMLRYFTGTGQRMDLQSRSDPHEKDVSAESLYIRKITNKYNLDMLDLQILEHYFSSSYKTFVTTDRTEQIWLDVVPSLASNHPFLLKGILACTALHMAHLDHTQCQRYTIRAFLHQEPAIPLFRYAINNPTEENCDAIMVFAYILVVYSFAIDIENSNKSFLIIDDFNTDSSLHQEVILPQWLYFIRAGCSMLCDVWDRIESGPVSLLAAAWETKDNVGDGELPYLDHFLSIVPDDGSWEYESILIYRRAATALAESFAHLERARVKSDINMWNVLGGGQSRWSLNFSLYSSTDTRGP